eukprot:3855091-Amphidinium_carterae.4
MGVTALTQRLSTPGCLQEFPYHLQNGNDSATETWTWLWTCGRAPFQNLLWRATSVTALEAKHFPWDSVFAVATGDVQNTWWHRHAWMVTTRCAATTPSWKPDPESIGTVSGSTGSEDQENRSLCQANRLDNRLDERFHSCRACLPTFATVRRTRISFGFLFSCNVLLECPQQLAFKRLGSHLTWPTWKHRAIELCGRWPWRTGAKSACPSGSSGTTSEQEELGEPAHEALHRRRVTERRWIFAQCNTEGPDDNPFRHHTFDPSVIYSRVDWGASPTGRVGAPLVPLAAPHWSATNAIVPGAERCPWHSAFTCLLYTSDAADDTPC